MIKKITKLLILLGLLGTSACSRPVHDAKNEILTEINIVRTELEGAQAEVAELRQRVALLELAAEEAVTVRSVVDPCGDGPGVDEILLSTSEGVMAWYVSTGLVLLDDGSYRTTDSQSCRFDIVDGEYVEL